MDAKRFDSLTRSLSAERSRRSVAWLLSGLVLGGPLVVVGRVATQAKRKKKITLCHFGQTITVTKKAKKPHLQHGDTLGPCASPTAGCPSEQIPCRGSCIPNNQCCTDSDCPALRPHCLQGVCMCPSDKPHGDCPGSNECRQCCTVDDCRVDEVGRADGLACRDGQCVCTIPGTRMCGFAGQVRCDACCSDSECPNNLRCDFDAIDPASCGCPSAIRCGDTCVSCLSNTMCAAQCFNIGEPCCAPLGDLPGLFCREVGDPGSGVAFCQL